MGEESGVWERRDVAVGEESGVWERGDVAVGEESAVDLAIVSAIIVLIQF